MGNLYKNQNLKFSMWAKRLVWGAVEGTNAVEQVIADEKKKDAPEQDVVKLKDAALAKVGEDEVAKAQIEAAEGRFQAFVRAVQQRTFTQTTLDAINITSDNVDIAAWINKLEPLNIGRDSLVAQFGEDDRVVQALTAKNQEITDMEGQSDAKKKYYDDLLKTKPPVLAEDADETAKKAYITALLAYIAKLDVHIAQGYTYLDVGEKAAMDTAFFAAVAEARQELSGPNSALTSLLNDDQKTSLANEEFAASNWHAAQKGGEEQHKAGAKECWTASVAEQEARNIWNQLAYTEGDVGGSFRAAEFGKPVEVWNAQGPWKKLYEDGLVAFNKGMENFKTSKGTGKWNEATTSFREATAKWSELLNEQNRRGLAGEEKEKEKSKEEEEKKAVFEFAQKTHIAAMEIIKKLNATDVAKVEAYTEVRDKITALSANLQEQKAEVDYTSGGYAELEGLKTQLSGFETEYNNLKSEILPGRMATAIEHIKGQYSSDNRSVDAEQVVNDYVGADKLGLTTFQKDVLTKASGMVLRGVYEAMDSGGMKKRFAVVAINKGEKWEVTTNVQARANEQVKLFSSQDALNFAKEKAKAAFFQQANPDKAEAIEDYILDMSEWSPDLGGASRAEDVYLQMLEGEEFDVQNSDFHVRISGGKVIVTRKPSVPGGTGGSGGAGGTGGSGTGGSGTGGEGGGQPISGGGGRPTIV